VREPEAASDQAAVTKELLDFFRVSVGSDVKILGFPAEQKIANAAADQIGLIAAILEPIEDLECVFADPGT